MSAFDKEAVFDSEVLPLIERIRKICAQHGIPMLTVFCFSDDGHDARGIAATCEGPTERVPDVMKMMNAVLRTTLAACEQVGPEHKEKQRKAAAMALAALKAAKK